MLYTSKAMGKRDSRITVKFIKTKSSCICARVYTRACVRACVQTSKRFSVKESRAARKLRCLRLRRCVCVCVCVYVYVCAGQDTKQKQQRKFSCYRSWGGQLTGWPPAGRRLMMGHNFFLADAVIAVAAQSLTLPASQPVHQFCFFFSYFFISICCCQAQLKTLKKKKRWEAKMEKKREIDASCKESAHWLSLSGTASTPNSIQGRARASLCLSLFLFVCVCVYLHGHLFKVFLFFIFPFCLYAFSREKCILMCDAFL